MNRAPVTIALAAALALAAGCMGYRFGSMLPGGVRSICITTFVNQAGEPDVEYETTEATIREFQIDGTLRVAGLDEADAVLEATVTGYDLKPLGFSEDRATQAAEYRLTILANVVLRERASGRILARRSGCRGRATFEAVGDMGLAKQNALPAAAEDLAHDIVESLVEAW